MESNTVDQEMEDAEHVKDQLKNGDKHDKYANGTNDSEEKNYENEGGQQQSIVEKVIDEK